MLHVHVLFVAPLCAGDMPQAGADQHECRVPIRKAAHDTGAPADLPIQPFYDVIGTECSEGKSA
jgi:hypothetical protein